MRVAKTEEKAFRDILKLIMSQKYSPGDRIVEGDIASELNLSMTPVRNVLRQFVAVGVLEQVPRMGCCLPRLEPNDMRDVFRTRIYLEPQAAYIAAQNITDAQVRELEEMLEREREYFSKREHDPYSEVNERFHMEIAKISGNAYLARFIQHIYWRAALYTFFFDRFYRRRVDESKALRDPDTSNSCREHIELVEALASRDPERAREAMYRHVESTYNSLSTHRWAL